MPEPTVKVRMKENAVRLPLRTSVPVIALGDMCRNEKEITMTLTRYAFIKAGWHDDIVDQALAGFCELIDPGQVDVFDVPGAFEMPLVARDLAASGRYGAVAATALIVDGGIYRHDFVASAVVDGLMRAGLDTGVPVLSVALSPHQFQDTAHHRDIYRAHFVLKGREAAQAALAIGRTRAALAA
jgi:6,7-dimethyl-8-ribityllumazine synthase